MAEIEITLPTIQYGNVKLTCQPEELDGLIKSADTLGVATAVYLNIFTQGFKAGAQMDVSAPVGASPGKAASQPSTAPQGAEQSEVDRVIEETVKAAQILADGLGGATEIETTSVVEASGIAPWDDSDLKVDAKPKPWETESKPIQSVSELISDEW